MSLRKSLITAYAATVLAMFSSPLGAQTDRYFFSEHGDWEVNVEVSVEGDMLCSAITRNQFDETFDVTIWEDGAVSIFFWFDNPGIRIFSQPMRIMIPRVSSHQIPVMQMTTNGGFHRFDSPLVGLEFILNLQKGQEVHVTRPVERDGSGIFSLRGSRAAMNDLFKCFGMLQGTGA